MFHFSRNCVSRVFRNCVAGNVLINYGISHLMLNEENSYPKSNCFADRALGQCNPEFVCGFHSAPLTVGGKTKHV